MTTTLYRNGKVFTGTGPDHFASAFEVTDSVFSWVGEEGDAPYKADSEVDLSGATVIPGLIEAHEHALIVAGIANSTACTIPAVTDIPSMIEALRKNPSYGKGPDRWITGWGYDETKLAEHRTPTRHDLDLVSTTQPIYIIRSDCHSGICNTKALELAGVTRDTPDPAVGAFGREADGTPNGILFELEANARVRSLAEKPDFESVVKVIAGSARHFHERGYSVVTEMMARRSPLNTLEAFRAAEPLGFDLQAALYLVWEGGEDDRGMADITENEKTGRIRIAGVKLFADGSVSGRTAWVNEPYQDGTTGLSTLTPAAIRAAVSFAKRNGVQLAIHVMGDHAIDQILEVLEGETDWLQGIPSVRLEHVTLITPEQLERIRRSRLTFGMTTQVIFPFAEIESYEASLCPGPFKRMYPVKTLEKSVEALALSSDSPATTWMDPDDPAVSLEAAVRRVAYNGHPINREEGVTLGTALTLYTGRAAKLFAKESPAGVIAPGAEADFSILEADPFTMPEDRIHEMRVKRGFLRGAEVFRRED